MTEANKTIFLIAAWENKGSEKESINISNNVVRHCRSK
jgi:hypothetical protein